MNAPRRRFVPASVTRNLLIEAPFVCIDADGEYDAETGELVTVWVGRKPVWPDDIARVLTLLGCDYPGWKADLDQHVLGELVAQAAQDMADDYADWRSE